MAVSLKQNRSRSRPSCSEYCESQTRERSRSREYSHVHHDSDVHNDSEAKSEESIGEYRFEALKQTDLDAVSEFYAAKTTPETSAILAQTKTLTSIKMITFRRRTHMSFFWLALDPPTFTRLKDCAPEFLKDASLKKNIFAMFIRHNVHPERLFYNFRSTSAIETLSEPTPFSMLVESTAHQCMQAADLQPRLGYLPWVLLTRGRYTELHERCCDESDLTLLVFLCLSGNGTFFYRCRTNFKRPIRPGTCFIYPKYSKHCWKSNDNSPLTVLTVRLCGPQYISKH